MLPNTELYEADISRKCVEAARAKGQLHGVQVLLGDQAKQKTLMRWRKQLGADLDAIVDDGGHRNSEISSTFDALWPMVKLGGVYIIEDMQVGRLAPIFEDTGGTGVMVDKITAWMHQLLNDFEAVRQFRTKVQQNIGNI